MTSRPRRKKLVLILIIITTRALDALEHDDDGTVWEVLTNQLSELKPQMAIAEANWTSEQDAVWDVIEELDLLLEATPIDEEAVQYISDVTLKDALNNL